MPSRFQRKHGIRGPYKKIIIAMEGNNTEPDYFKAVKNKYRAATLDIELLERDKNDTKSAPEYIIQKLDQFKKTHRLLVDDELWLVIDKDRWPKQKITAIANQCSNKGYKLGLSNPCFELWFILHFNDISILSEARRQMLSSSNGTQKEWAKIQNVNNGLSSDQIVLKIEHAIIHGEKLDTNKRSKFLNDIGTRVYLLAKTIIKNYKNDF